MTGLTDALAARFREHLGRVAPWSPGDALLVAVSGGLDSTVLLHLLRFAVDRSGIHAGHVDHGMRPSSGADRLWLRGLTRAWQLPLHELTLDVIPRSETEARDARYRALERLRKRAGASWILTAHHADDQAETVLYRVVRGTGIRGLAGIPTVRGSRVRPLLPFTRPELRAYASAVRLRWRDDPMNADATVPRNVLRHRILPELEASVAPGARPALLRLARHAATLDAALTTWVLGPDVADPRETGTGIALDRERILGLPEPLRALALRAAYARVGGTLDEAGTRSLIEFTSHARSGSELTRGGAVVRREFGRILLEPLRAHQEDAGLRVPGPEQGEGMVRVGGRRFRVRWNPERLPGMEWEMSLPVDRIPFPLDVRPWRHGDRMRMTYGTKKLSKLFAEHRVGLEARRQTPLLADAEGRVLWVPGIARAHAPGRSDDHLLHVGIERLEG